MRMRTEFVMSIMDFSPSDFERVFLRAGLLQFVGTRFVDGLFLRCVKVGESHSQSLYRSEKSSGPLTHNIYLPHT